MKTIHSVCPPKRAVNVEGGHPHFIIQAMIAENDGPGEMGPTTSKYKLLALFWSGCKCALVLNSWYKKYVPYFHLHRKPHLRDLTLVKRHWEESTSIQKIASNKLWCKKVFGAFSWVLFDERGFSLLWLMQPWDGVGPGRCRKFYHIWDWRISQALFYCCCLWSYLNSYHDFP